MEEVWRLKLEDVSIGGGLAQSDCLVQMLSDVLGLPVKSYRLPQVTSLGTAMCAAVGAGMYVGFKEAVEAMRPAPRTLEPSPEACKEYVRHYERWLSTADWFDKLVDDIG